MLVDLHYDPNFSSDLLKYIQSNQKLYRHGIRRLLAGSNIPSIYYFPVRWLVSQPSAPGAKALPRLNHQRDGGRGARGSLGVMYAAGVPV